MISHAFFELLTIPVHDHVAVIHVVMTLASLSTPEIWTLEVRIN